MKKYIARRLLYSIPVLWFVTIFVFGALNLIPGDVVVAQFEERNQPTQEELQRLREELGIDRPLVVQYFSWLAGVLRGDLGNSLLNRQPVANSVLRALPVSVELGVLTSLVAFAIAVPLGVLSAIRQDTWADYAARLFSIGGLAIPSFVVATLVVILPAIWWGWLPPIKTVGFLDDPLTNLKQFSPAAISLGLHFSATTLRMTRSSMLEILREDYVRTAYAKGLGERLVIYRHALRNAMIPVITVMGSLLANLLGGLVVVEAIFGLPGLGLLVLRSIDFSDYTALSGTVLVIALMVVLTNLIVDITYSWFDPRIRYS